MKLAIVGTRNPAISYDEWCKLVSPYIESVTEIISGGADGIDTYAHKLAQSLIVPITEHKPDYSKYGRLAPIVRNTRIVEDADVVLAFPSKESRGTLDTIRKAKKANKRIIVVTI